MKANVPFTQRVVDKCFDIFGSLIAALFSVVLAVTAANYYEELKVTRLNGRHRLSVFRYDISHSRTRR